MLNATIKNRIDITPELVVFQITPDGGVSDFKPGQYVAVGLMGSAPRPAHFPPERETPKPDKIVKRAYSIGSSPTEKGFLEFYIAIVPDGTLTSRLVMLKPGDRVYVAPKVVGDFTLDEVPSDANLVFVSTGTGIAPFISMLRTKGTCSQNRKIALIHGVRFNKDLAYRDELAQYAREFPGFSYHPVVSREQPISGGTKGHAQSLFHNNTVTTDPTKDHVFLCGNPAMVEEVEKLLLGKGYTVHSKKAHGSLHLEKYW